MKVAAVIAEYNPFHNGHFYQLNTIRWTLNADIILVVMSGDFMQRGIPAIADKYERCQMALENGADLVFELPVYFALGSAEYFAQGAVSLLDKLGVVDFLHFGSESGDLSLLYEFTNMMLAQESDAYKKALNNYLKRGDSFPAARDNALSELLPSQDIRNLISTPNNILGIEYLKALIQRNSAIKPVTLTRNGERFASAHAIRNALNQESAAPPLCVKDHVPASVYTHLQRTDFLCTNDFSEILLYKMLQDFDSKDAFADYYDINKQLSHTLYHNLPRYTTFEDFVLLCKTKNLTYTHICRGLLHILLDMRQEHADLLKHSGCAQYARLLGFTARGKQLLKSIKTNASIPVITKPSHALKQLRGTALLSLQADIHAADIYDGVRQQKQLRWSGQSAKIVRNNELTRQVIKFP